MGNDNSILIVVLAVVAYLFFIQPSTGTKTKDGERYCPKGERYPASQWELLFGCREGYDRKPFGDDCVCTAQTPATNPEAAHSPQTSAPFTSPEAAQRAVSRDCKVFDNGVWWQRHFNPDGTVAEARATILDYLLPECR